MKKRGREIYNATCFKYSQQKVVEGPHTLLHEIQHLVVYSDIKYSFCDYSKNLFTTLIGNSPQLCK